MLQRQRCFPGILKVFPQSTLTHGRGVFGVTIFLVGIAGMACVMARMTHWLTIWADSYFFSISYFIPFHISLSFNTCQHQNTVVINGTFLNTLMQGPPQQVFELGAKEECVREIFFFGWGAMLVDFYSISLK